MAGARPIDYTQAYARFDAAREAQAAADEDRKRVRSALSNFMRRGQQVTLKQSGFRRIELCRQALLAIDRRGWERSFHQRQFHDQFLRACARVFWKTEPHGAFARCHQQLLEQNGWPHLSQEILVSTPRRFGKTISVSMFAAAMIFAAPGVEVSVYSTCKRISQKLLRNIHKFLEMIYAELGVEPYRIERMNMEEIALHGPEGAGDLRIVNSYPSKVTTTPPPCLPRALVLVEVELVRALEVLLVQAHLLARHAHRVRALEELEQKVLAGLVQQRDRGALQPAPPAALGAHHLADRGLHARARDVAVDERRRAPLRRRPGQGPLRHRCCCRCRRSRDFNTPAVCGRASAATRTHAMCTPINGTEPARASVWL